MGRGQLLLAAVAAVAVLTADASAEQGPTGEVDVVLHQPRSQRPIIGPRLAPVTIEFFMDQRSSSGRLLYARLMELSARHPQRLRIIIRLPFSDEFSNVAREAFRQGAFRAYGDEVYGGRRHYRTRQLESIAVQTGVDWLRAKRRLDASYHVDEANHDRLFAKRWGIHVGTSTPGVLINGRPHPVRNRTLTQLEASYDQAYARAMRLLDRGVPLAELYPRLLVEQIADRRAPDIRLGQIDGPSLEAEERVAVYPAKEPIDVTGPHVLGRTDAPVVVTVFCALPSRLCSKNTLALQLKEISVAYQDEVRLVFKHVHDPQAEDGETDDDQADALHRAALCAEEQASFWPFFFSRGRFQRIIDDDYFENLANQLKLDAKQFVSCAESERHKKTLTDALAEARRVGVIRTPTIAIGSRLYVGSRSFADLRDLIDRQLVPGLLGRWAW